MDNLHIADFFNLQSDGAVSVDKPLCINCVKQFKGNEELFIYNQYCTGFCSLLHVKTVQPQTAEVIEKEVFKAA